MTQHFGQVDCLSSGTSNLNLKQPVGERRSYTQHQPTCFTCLTLCHTLNLSIRAIRTRDGEGRPCWAVVTYWTHPSIAGLVTVVVRTGCVITGRTRVVVSVRLLPVHTIGTEVASQARPCGVVQMLLLTVLTGRAGEALSHLVQTLLATVRAPWTGLDVIAWRQETTLISLHKSL